MSKFVINLDEPNSETTASPEPTKRRGCSRILGILGIISLIILLIGAVVGYFYWQSVKKTPQYSLALLVDAARRDDKEKVAQIVDTESVVNNFVPQISEKAVELYGRNLPPQVINRVALLVAPLMPSIKVKAKEELPQLIREKTQNFDRVPWWAIALFAERGLDIKIDGETATIKSKDPTRPAEFTMKRDGQIWKITTIKDENLAQKVAEKVGQQIIALAKKGSITDAGRELGVENLGNILKGLNDIFK
jgi:hypothetical protein